MKRREFLEIVAGACAAPGSLIDGKGARTEPMFRSECRYTLVYAHRAELLVLRKALPEEIGPAGGAFLGFARYDRSPQVFRWVAIRREETLGVFYLRSINPVRIRAELRGAAGDLVVRVVLPTRTRVALYREAYDGPVAHGGRGSYSQFVVVIGAPARTAAPVSESTSSG